MKKLWVTTVTVIAMATALIALGSLAVTQGGQRTTLVIDTGQTTQEFAKMASIDLPVVQIALTGTIVTPSATEAVPAISTERGIVLTKTHAYISTVLATMSDAAQIAAIPGMTRARAVITTMAFEQPR